MVISAHAERAGLSRSTYIKRICLGQPTPSLEKLHARRDLMKAHADLGRLGGLFKLCLSERRGHLLPCIRKSGGYFGRLKPGSKN